MNEQERVHACKRGELEHFEELYTTYVKDIYGFVYYRVRDKETAEDIVGDVFFKALRNISKCDENQSFRPWIYTIARNTLIDYYRKHKATSSLDSEDAPDIYDESQNIERDTENNEILEKVEVALEELSDTQKEIVMMRVWDGLSYKEIAVITGKTEGNCKVIFSRSVAEIRHLVPISAYILLALNTIEL